MVMGGDNYRTVCEIARGGMGVVELVVRKEQDFVRLYARKRLLSSLAEDDVHSMFLDEARIAGMLRHPNVVSVLDVGVLDGDEGEEGPYLLMDYVEGVPLSDVIVSYRRRGLAVPLQLCMHIIENTAEGLHAAHELRSLDGTHLALVHRDVSPANILVEPTGRVRVADFGIAKALGRRTKTSEGLLKGKTGYLAPEVLRFQEPDRRTDLFALGVVLFELATSSRLYRGANMLEAARRILEEPVPDLAEARFDSPPGLVDLAFRLLAKDPEARPASALEVANAARAIRRELIEKEGELDVAAALSECIDQETFVQRRLAAETIARNDRPARQAAPVVPRAGVPWQGAIAGAVLLVLAGASIAIWARGDTSTETVTEADTMATAAEPETPPLVAPVEIEPEPEDLEPDIESEADETMDEAIVGAAAPETMRPTMRRRNMRAAAMTATMEATMEATMRASTMDPWTW